jgi:cyclopropane-fatty-acyl-phospholipid synthase
MKMPFEAALGWAERGRMPDFVLRRGIDALVKSRLASLPLGDAEALAALEERFIAAMDRAPVAPAPREANEQHYEVPAAFFAEVLGRRRKYSCCLFADGVQDLNEAEAAALDVTCERAGLAPGQRVLELGCGWGSLTLWMAEHYPGIEVTAVSSSRAQAAAIRTEADRRGLSGVRIITVDMNALALDERFDRVVSVEMLEHMRNWRVLFARVHDWLVPGGRFFLHVFCHRAAPYLFVDEGPSDWMTRYFFAGGMMPSDGLALRFQDRLRLRARWRWDGRHYARTAEAWLARLDARREQVLPILAEAYGPDEARRWLQRWRLFFLAVSGLFGYAAGQEWWVGHYLFERPPPDPS